MPVACALAAALQLAGTVSRGSVDRPANRRVKCAAPATLASGLLGPAWPVTLQQRFPRARTVPLLLRPSSPVAFANGARFARARLPRACRIVQAETRSRHAGLPIVYVNNNVGEWRADFKTMVRPCRS